MFGLPSIESILNVLKHLSSCSVRTATNIDGYTEARFKELQD